MTSLGSVRQWTRSTWDTKAATRLPCDAGNFLQLIYKMGQ